MTMNYSKFSDESLKKFVGFLYRQTATANRANLAELRRSATDPLNDYRSIWLLGPYLPDSDGWSFDAYRLVATLFAIHSQKFPEREMPKFKPEQNRTSLGTSLGLLKKQLVNGAESLDKRFAALLDTPTEDLAIPLRNTIQRIATADRAIPVDYYSLVKDLIFWESPYTKKKWAREYWQPQFVNDKSDNA